MLMVSVTSVCHLPDDRHTFTLVWVLIWDRQFSRLSSSRPFLLAGCAYRVVVETREPVGAEGTREKKGHRCSE